MKDCTETQNTWNCNEILQQILGTNVANYTTHAQDYKLIATTWTIYVAN
jgi:putative N-acetylmannosamine-6-phosphate epimerase